MTVTIDHLLRQASRRFSTRPFLHDPKQRVTISYRAADQLVTTYATLLRSRGVQSGDRVVIVSETRIEVALLVFGAARAGAVIVVLGEPVRVERFRRIHDEVAPRLVIVSTRARVVADSCDPANTISIGAFPLEGSGGDDRGSSGAGDSWRVVDEAALIYTSGSSGRPRGVIVTHENILFTSERIQRRLRYRPDDVVGLFLPLSFDYGLYQLFLAARSGASVALGDGFVAGPLLVRTLHENRISVLPAMPGLATALLRLLPRHPDKLPDLRCLTSTGECLRPQTVSMLRDILPYVAVFSMYGLTECKRATILLPSEVGERPGSVGKPLDDVEIEVIDEGGEAVPAGTLGQIVVRGKNVCRGYWRRPKATARQFVGSGSSPTLLTGDYGWRDHDGYLYVGGRRDALLKHRGYRISATEIEAAFAKVPGILEAVAVKARDRDDLHVFLVCDEKAGEQPHLAEIHKQLEAYKLPDYVQRLKEMPRTANGKVNRTDLRARVDRGGDC